MKNKLKVIFTIIGTVIGAGFASGQEIYSFFSIYNKNGFVGIILSCILTGIIIYIVLEKANKQKISSYKELIQKTKLPAGTENLLNIIVNLFLVLSFYIMVAGFATYFKQEFNIPKIIMIILSSYICYITFNRKIEGITKINNIIIPILIFIICGIGLKANIFDISAELGTESANGNWLIKGIEYVSYNSILLIPMLISIKNYAKGKEKEISLVSTIILLILALIIFRLLLKNMNQIEFVEMPMVYIADELGSVFKYIYGIVIVFSIYSTMISAGYGFLENVESSKYKFWNRFICISSIFVANISFSGLINITYPVFGFLGIIQLIALFCSNKK